MNPIELLMAEHATLRVYFRHLRSLNSDYLFEVDDFILGCHARIEDEVVFPALRSIGGDKASTIASVTSKLEEEHRVLQMLSNKMRVQVAETAAQLDRDAIALYASTVESHNSAEETSVFRHWGDVNKEDQAQSADLVRKLISEFGTARYLRATCFSQEFLSLLA
jgi:hemerythrin superfamily protein